MHFCADIIKLYKPIKNLSLYKRETPNLRPKRIIGLVLNQEYVGVDKVTSVSRINCVATIRGKGAAKVTLYRHLAPLTIAAISRALPFQSRVSVSDAMVCAFTNVRAGVERPRLSFKRGEVAFFPMNAVICFFTKDVKSERPLSPLGKIGEGIELFDSVKPGDVIELHLEAE